MILAVEESQLRALLPQRPGARAARSPERGCGLRWLHRPNTSTHQQNGNQVINDSNKDINNDINKDINDDINKLTNETTNEHQPGDGLGDEEMTTPAPTRRSRLPALAYSTAVVTFVADILLMLTYVFEVATDGPYYYATAHRIFGAISHILIAALVIRLGRMTEPIGPSRLLVGTTVVVSLLGAVFLLLGTSGLLGFSESSLIAVVVLIVQALWMLRANTWLYYQGVFPPILARSGQIIGGGLLIGIGLVAVSVFLPRLTLPHLIVLVAGVFIGGGQWLAWPIWFVMLGWQMRWAPDAAEESEADVAADAESAVPGESSRGFTSQPSRAADPELVAPPLWLHASAAASHPQGSAPTERRGDSQPATHSESHSEPEPPSDFDRMINPQLPTDARSELGTVPQPLSEDAVTPRHGGAARAEPDDGGPLATPPRLEPERREPRAADAGTSGPPRVDEPELQDVGDRDPEVTSRPTGASRFEPPAEPVHEPAPEPAPERESEAVVTRRTPVDPDASSAQPPDSAAPPARPAGAAKQEPRGVSRPSKPRSVQPSQQAKMPKAQPPGAQLPDPERVVTSPPPGATKVEPKGVSQQHKPRSAPPLQPPSVPPVQPPSMPPPEPQAQPAPQTSDSQPEAQGPRAEQAIDSQPKAEAPPAPQTIDSQPEAEAPLARQASDSSAQPQIPPAQQPGAARPRRRKVPKSEQRSATKPEPPNTTDTPWYHQGKRH